MVKKQNKAKTSPTLKARRTLLRALQEAVHELGPNFTQQEFLQSSGVCIRHIHECFGTWAEFRQTAGLKRRPVPKYNLRYKREDVLTAMREAVDVFGPQIRFQDFRSHCGMTMAAVKRHFGGWRALREEVGLNPFGTHGSRPRFTRDELVRRLKELAAKRGDVSRLEFCRELHASPNVFTTYGSWTELRTAAGLPKQSQQGKPRWLQDLIADIPDPVELLDDPDADVPLDPAYLPYAHLTMQDALRMTEPPANNNDAPPAE